MISAPGDQHKDRGTWGGASVRQGPSPYPGEDPGRQGRGSGKETLKGLMAHHGASFCKDTAQGVPK